MISVLIADDHQVVVDGLKALIETQSDMKVLGTAGDGLGAIQACHELSPDVVLMDYAMPLMNGSAATEVITERWPEIKVVLLTMHSDLVHIKRALRAGAMGCLLKRASGNEVLEGIRGVARGDRYLSPELNNSLLASLQMDASAEDRMSTLSSRERQVLQLLVEGHSTSEIGPLLALSPRTAETYRTRIMAKLGIHDLPGLVKFAIKEGMVHLI